MGKTLLEAVCEADRDRLLSGSAGYPADQLEEVLERLGLQVEHEELGSREAALDLAQARIIINTSLPRLCHGQADLEGLRASLIAHEIGHFRLHRWELQIGARLTFQHEHEAHTYAQAFLLPRERLRTDGDVRHLWERARRGKPMPPAQLWPRLGNTAERFRVTTSFVVERLVQLDLLDRAGGQVGLRNHLKARPTHETRPANLVYLSSAR